MKKILQEAEVICPQIKHDNDELEAIFSRSTSSSQNQAPSQSQNQISRRARVGSEGRIFEFALETKESFYT